nr:unnamed protein product [Digitaria exilis]
MSPSADAAAPASTSGPPLAPLIAAQLSYLLSHSKLPIKVEQIWSGCRNGRYSDRFTLSIPFCLDYVHWDFLYNALAPKVAPDVVFGPDDEGFQPLVDYAEAGSGDKSCLAGWDYRDPRGLLALMHELRELYVEYHKKQVAKVDDARVTFELSTVLSKEGIEVCMVPSADRPEEVKFAVPLLDVDFDFAKLVIFPISRSSSYSSVPSAPRLKLISTPDLKSLFSVEDEKLPPWSNGMCLAEYLPALEESLNLRVVEASASIGARRRFIEALAPTFGRPIEADPHLNADGTPIMSLPINDYPWSPRWDQAEMVERIYDFLTDECQNFKKFCSDTITQQK